MPAPSTLSDFLDVCRKSGVIDEKQLSTISGPSAASPVTAAKALIRKGALTKFQAGQLLAGKYRGLRFDRLKILDKIGSGGMGTVFLCEHLGLRKQVAVKVLPPDQAGDEGIRERFFREARAAASLDHPNIVRVHDMNTSGGVHYIVMEYVDGQDLQSIINKYGPMPHGRACNYIAQAALGLQHAHEKGLVHRDVKPANLLVDKEGVVKLLDLGLATFNNESDEKDNLTARFDKGAILGTADYMAPEQILSSSDVDIRADIYSLGVTLYALINGKPPFSGSCTQKMVGHTSVTATSLTNIRREVPKGLSTIVDRMMAKDPAQRFQTPAEVVDALNPWLEADTIPLDGGQTRKIPGNSKTGRRKELRKKSRMPLIVAAVAISALVFGGLGAWALTGSDKSDKASAASNTGPIAKTQPSASTPAQGNLAPKTPATPINRNEARLTYEIDFAKVPAFSAKFNNKNRVGMEGSYPPGWASLSWRGGAVAEVSIQDHGGSRGVVLRTNQGEGGSSELHTAFGASPFAFTPGKRYLLRTEYANIGTKTGSFEVRFNNEHPPVKNAVALKPTRGEWQTADLTFVAPPHERVTTYYTNSAAVYPNYMVVRSVQVFEFGNDTPLATGPARLVFEEDFSKGPAFSGTTAKPGGLTMQKGRLPEGWTSFVWRDDASGEVAQEEFAGKKAIAFRTIVGDNCAEVTNAGQTSTATIKAGHTYRVDVEYAAPGDLGGRFDVRFDDMSKPGADQARFERTGNSWQTATAQFMCPADKDRPFSIYLVNYGAGKAETVFVHSVKLFDLTTAPNLPGAAAPTGYRLDLSNAKSFAKRFRKEAEIESQGDGKLPAPWAGHTLQGDTLGDVFVDSIGGTPVLGIRNEEGPASVELYCKSGLCDVKAGKKYAVRITYQNEANGKGGLQVAIDGQECGRTDFTSSIGTWKDVELTITATTDGPLTMTITCGSVGSEASVFIKSIEVAEAK